MEYLVFNELGEFNSHTTNLELLESRIWPLGWVYVLAPSVWNIYTSYIDGVFKNNIPPPKERNDSVSLLPGQVG